MNEEKQNNEAFDELSDSQNESTENVVEPTKEEKQEPEQKKSRKEKRQQKQVEELENKVAELNDKYLRLFSEFDNYRKRTAREKIEMSKTASEGLIQDLLPVLDDMERALVNIPEVEQNKELRQGVELIFSKFLKILENKGLKAIEAKGLDFDTDFHEAIAKFPAPTPEQKGKVIDDTVRGYMLNDKVIRFSKVVVGE
ncbi:MAG: nucleotide exchange factor GrpE [Bacteroidales bacterium]|nr:nucleotide exchange factor GrpE [Bacteroidales bacterium]